MSTAEVESLRRADAARWFREQAAAAEGATGDPFEAVPGWRGYHRIRKRPDGACGFLSPDNRYRIHEQLGAGLKPLTCRVFPYSFHPAPAAVIVKTSFGCPTVVANQGEPIAQGARLEEITALRADWFAGRRSSTPPRFYARGRPMSAGSLRILRDNLKIMLDGTDDRGRIDLRGQCRPYGRRTRRPDARPRRAIA